MRNPKPSDIQALEVLQNELDQIVIQLTTIRGRVNNFSKQLKQYITQEQEPINVSTTSGHLTDG